MLSIAARITNGAMRGMVWGMGEGGEKVGCRWDYSDGDEAVEKWEEDDFGVDLSNDRQSRSRSRSKSKSKSLSPSPGWRANSQVQGQGAGLRERKRVVGELEGTWEVD
jgi:hypothetical protein